MFVLTVSSCPIPIEDDWLSQMDKAFAEAASPSVKIATRDESMFYTRKFGLRG